MISSAGKEASHINNQTPLRRCSIRKRKIKVMVATALSISKSRSKCSKLRTQLHQMHQQRQQQQQPRHNNLVAQINQTKIDSLKFLGLTRKSLYELFHNEVDIY